MTEVAFSSSFKRAFKKRIKGNAVMEMRFWERLEFPETTPSIKTLELTSYPED